MEDRLVHASRIAREVETHRVTLLMNDIQQKVWEASARAKRLMGGGTHAFDLTEQEKQHLVRRFDKLGFDCCISPDGKDCHIIVVTPQSFLTEPEPTNETYEASLANAHVKGETINDV